MVILIRIIGWIICSIISYGGMFAYAQKTFPTLESENKKMKCIMLIDILMERQDTLELELQKEKKSSRWLQCFR